MATLPSEVAVSVRAELGNAVVGRPGDKLVIGTGFITQEHAAQIKERVAKELPGVEAVIIAGITNLAVYQPDEQQVLPALADRMRAKGIPEGTIAMMTAAEG